MCGWVCLVCGCVCLVCGCVCLVWVGVWLWAVFAHRWRLLSVLDLLCEALNTHCLYQYLALSRSVSLCLALSGSLSPFAVFLMRPPAQILSWTHSSNCFGFHTGEIAQPVPHYFRTVRPTTPLCLLAVVSY
jgi:hypothetical protein